MNVPTRALPSDEVLVVRLRDGDEAAFTLVLDAWSTGMLRLARSFVSTNDSAAEVVQDTWQAVIQGIEKFESRSSLKTWVYRILVNTAGKITQIWQWWDFQQPTSIDPPTRVVVNEWLSSPGGRASQGYPTIGVQDGPLYVSPGFGARPGSYGFFDVRTTYRDYPFADIPGVLGYHVARWSDRTQEIAIGWVDYFARRPIAVVADRTWAAPGGDVRPFLDRYDQVGDANPVSEPDPADLASQIGANTGMLSQDGWVATASDEETAGEDGRAARAVDNDPYTHWHSRYSEPLPHRLDVDLGTEQRIAGVRYMPRQDGGVNGMIKDFEVLVSDDGSDWRTVAAGRFAADRTEFIVPFAGTTTRYVALRALSEYGGQNRFAAVAEFDVVRAR